MKKKMIMMIVSCVLIVAMLAGCGKKTDNANDNSNDAQNQTGDETDADKGDKGTAAGSNTFTYAITADPGNTLNAITAEDRFSLMTLKYLYSQLYSINEDGSKNFYLAESIESSEDGLVWTVTLKSGVLWNDGTAFTADDVVFTYEKYNEETTKLFVNDAPIAVEKVDDTTVNFTLPEASASVEETLINEVFILPAHVFEGKDSVDVNLLEEAVVSTGPYVFEEYKTGEYLKLAKNSNYFDGDVAVDTVVLRIIENDDTAKLALQNGEIDAWVASSPAYLDGIEGNDAFQITTYSEGRIAYLQLNTASEVMQNQEFRKGVLYALDREEILTAAYTSMDYATVSYSFLPENNKYYSENLEKYERDLDKAAEYLAKGDTTQLSLCYIESDASQSAQALVIQAQLKAAGIDLELVGLDQAAWISAAYDLENGEHDMYLSGIVMTRDPDGFAKLYDSRAEGVMNVNSDKVNELFDKGGVELDETVRQSIYEELQQEIADEAVFYPFGTNLRILVTSSRVSGLEAAGTAPVYTFEDISKLSVQ